MVVEDVQDGETQVYIPTNDVQLVAETLKDIHCLALLYSLNI